jgi:hypothetical protein
MLTRRIVDLVLSATVSPIGFIIACLAAEAAILHIGIDDLDEGYFVQQAKRVLHGAIPFRDFETLYTPGLTYLHAAVFLAFGGPSLMATRVVALAGRAAMALLTYVLARPLVRRRWTAALPALVLMLGTDAAPIRWESHPGWLSTSFALSSVWLVYRRWFVAAGVAAALAYLFKQNTGVFILGAIVLWLVGTRPSSAARALLAFVLVTLVWLLPLGLAAGDVRAMRVIFGAVNEAGLVSPPELAVLIPLVCVLAGWRLIRSDSNPYIRWYLLAGMAVFLTEFPRMDAVHLVWSAPLLLVVGAIALDRLPRLATAVSLAAAFALLAPVWTERITYLGLPREPVFGVEAPVQTASELGVVVNEIRRRTSPGEPIFVYPTSPLLYILSDRPNPTRFDHLNPGAADAQQIQQVVRDLAGVRLVVVSDYWRAHLGNPAPNAALEDYLAAHYTEVANTDSYRVLLADL